MILHLVTDRRRLAPGADDAAVLECVVRQVEQAVRAGIDVVQLRERDLDTGALADLARRAVALARGSRTRVVVNDRLDVALAVGADGVHLRGASLSADRVRELAPSGFLVGRSVHTAEDAASAGPVDYVIAGTVWASASKPDGHPLLGLEGLRLIVQSSAVPVLAIGGVEAGTVAALAAVGAAGVAAIGTWLGKRGDCRAIPLGEHVQAFREAGRAANMKTFPHTN